MGSDLETLRALQGTDLEISSLKRQLEALRTDIRDRQNEIKSYRDTISKADVAIRDHETRQKLREVEIAQFDKEIEDLQGHLKDARNNKEYAGFNTEIRSRTAEKKSVEDQVLQILESIEQEQAIKAEAEEAISGKESVCLELEKEISTEVGKIEKAISGYAVDRESLASRLENDLRSEYDRLFERYDGEALSTVEDGACMGCFMTLSSGDTSLLITGRNYIRCPSCGRLLQPTDAS